MRVVSLQISKLFLSVNDKIRIQLVNSVGDVLVSRAGYYVDVEHTLDSDIFEIPLKENEHIEVLSTYKLIIENGVEFNFTVPYSFDAKPHDLFSLLNIGCFKNMVNADFAKKLELYFTSQEPHFTNKERYLVELYEYYADEVIDGTSTIDIARAMDEYLATIKEEK